jgi:hypothetical protein
MAPNFTVFALLYADYTELACRCLSSLLQLPKDRVILRVLANEPGENTRNYLEHLIQQGDLLRDNVTIYDENKHKYPAMRAAFYNPAVDIWGVQTPYVMWLDDDSYLSFPMATERSTWPTNWLDAIENQLEDGVTLLGAPYSIRLSPAQIEWIKAQLWYRGRPISQPNMPFYTGGFWTARFRDIAALDYPWKTLDHNGGDVMLGAAMEQVRYRGKSIHGIMGSYVQKVAIINADDRGVESNAKRRGFSQKPIGYDYDPAQQAADAQLGETLNRASPPEPPVPPSPPPAKNRRVFRLDL